MLGVEEEEVHHFMTHGLIGVIRIGGVGGGGGDVTRTTVTATKTSLKKWIDRTASNFVALIPSRLIRQMFANIVEVEY